MARQLRLQSQISDSMVIQQQLPFLLKGFARAGSDVKIKLEKEPFDGRPTSPLDQDFGCLIDDRISCQADGSFVYEIPAFKASFDIYTLTLRCGREELTVRDIRIGEVWLLAGHSSLGAPLNSGFSQQELAELARYPEIRIFVQSEDGLDKKIKSYSAAPINELASPVWLRGDDAVKLGRASAVAYYFARDLQLELKIPVAIIETAMSETFAHSWLARERIEADQDLRANVEKHGFYRDESTWNMAGDWGHHQPGALYNHKLAPLIGTGLRGIVWQQGEKDRNEPDYYLKLMQSLINNWNTLFRSPAPEIESQKAGTGWILVSCPPALFRDDEGFALAHYTETLYKLKHRLSGPAAALPTYDLPFDSASEEKKSVKAWNGTDLPFSLDLLGSHLSKIAQGMSYLRKASPSAPECSGIDIVGNKMMLSFTNTGEGLRLSANDGRLKGFSICSSDRIFHEAQAKLLYGVRVMIWHDQISQPESVTYAFSSLNQESNLINRDLLPAVPFRADRQKSVYKLPSEWMHCDNLLLWGTDGSKSENDRTDIQKYLKLQPSWRVFEGSAALKAETANKKEGDASFLLTYKNENEPLVVFGPCLEYASLFPPYDISGYDSIVVDLFNPDRQMKKIALRLYFSPDSADYSEYGRQTLISALRWQSLSFSLGEIFCNESKKVYGIAFCLTDEKLNGSVYIDNIRLTLHE
jgi:hypothetical protein